MPSFEEQLVTTLSGLNKRFEQASTDLHDEISNAAQSIKKISNGEVDLVLDRSFETEQFVIYSLLLRKAESSHSLSIGFLIDTRGYPIKTGPDSTLRDDASRPNVEKLKDQKALQEFVMRLASNPDSPLVVKLAFLLRKKS